MTVDGATYACSAGKRSCWREAGGCASSTYHFNRGIGQVDELGQDLTILASGIKLGSVPQGENGSDELGEAFCPSSVGIGFAL